LKIDKVTQVVLYLMEILVPFLKKRFVIFAYQELLVVQ